MQSGLRSLPMLCAGNNGQTNCEKPVMGLPKWAGLSRLKRQCGDIETFNAGKKLATTDLIDAPSAGANGRIMLDCQSLYRARVRHHLTHLYACTRSCK